MPRLPHFRTLFRSGGLLSGSVILLISMTLVNAGNYLYNLILGRWLGPAAFADLSLIVTLMLVVTFITATFQLTAARFAASWAVEADAEALGGLRRWMGSLAWILGVVTALPMVLAAPLWQRFFQTESAWPFVILAVGIPIYFAQGVDRGMLQGQMRFGRLSLAYFVEMVTRLGAGLLFVALGWSVNGAVAGITLSFVATWLMTRAAAHGLPRIALLTPAQRATMLRYSGPVVAVYIGQILINNSDILIVKRFFPPDEAGLYAALALIGRVVFFATWSVVTVLFPMVARKHQTGEPHRHLLAAGLAVVALISTVIVVLTIVMPEAIIMLLFGPAYLAIAPLLWLYAAGTMVYALANVIVNYHLSADQLAGTLFAIIAGLAKVGLLWLIHDNLRVVVLVQIAPVVVLLVGMLLWDQWLVRRVWRAPATPPHSAA
jgi:O-antigen/teichoic acid export membrane protein